jgi:hypothetical protein
MESTGLTDACPLSDSLSSSKKSSRSVIAITSPATLAAGDDELGEDGPPVGSMFWDAVDAGLATAFSPVPEAAHMLMSADADVQTHLVHRRIVSGPDIALR